MRRREPGRHGGVRALAISRPAPAGEQVRRWHLPRPSPGEESGETRKVRLAQRSAAARVRTERFCGELIVVAARAISTRSGECIRTQRRYPIALIDW